MASDKAVLRTLTHARMALVKYGWVRGRFGHQGVGFCAMGAIRYAGGSSAYTRIFRLRSLNGALEELTVTLGLESSEDIPSWNDAIYRQSKDVVDAFDRAIVSVRERIEARK